MTDRASNRPARHLRRGIRTPQRVSSSSSQNLAKQYLYPEISPPQRVASSSAASSQSTWLAKVQLDAVHLPSCGSAAARAHRQDPPPRLLPRVPAAFRANLARNP